LLLTVRSGPDGTGGSARQRGRPSITCWPPARPKARQA